MATYEPPTADLPEFDTLVFTSLEENLTIAEADTRYLRFPLAQGDETIPNLTVGGVSTLGTATFTNNNPEYRIEYPVDNGRIDFFANTGGGVLTRGCKIDATGVHTNSKYDTIDETAGILNIGTLSGRTGAINIGTGTTATGAINIGTGNTTGSAQTIQLGRAGTGSNVNIGFWNYNGSNGQLVYQGGGQIGSTGNLNIFPNATSALTMGVGMTAGSVSILPADATSSTTTLNIASGSAYTGAINIGNGATSKNITIGSGAGGTTLIRGGTMTISSNATAINTLFATSTSGSLTIFPSDATASSTSLNIGTGSAYTGTINIGTGTGNTSSVNIGRSNMITVDGDSGGTPTIFFNRPITPSYTPSSIASTTLGYTDFPTASAFGTLSSTVSNIAQFSIGAGVWDVKARVRITSIASVAGNFFRMGFTSNASSLGTLYGDWNQDGISGVVNILLSGTFAVNSTTTIYVRGSCSAGGGGGACDTCDVIATRIA